MRRRLGLPVAGWILVDARSSRHLNLGLFSSHYVDVQTDWPLPHEVVGFTYWDSPPGYVLPDDVEALLADGPPPVAVCLGTSAASAHPELFTAAASALDAVGARGLFLTSREANGQGVGARSGSAHGTWPFVPLDMVLPRCRAVIHSGAHGSNALALRAGLPSVIRPCLQDQVWHARRQQQLGTGLGVRRDGFEQPLREILTDGSFTEGRSARRATAGRRRPNDRPRRHRPVPQPLTSTSIDATSAASPGRAC